MTRAVHSTPSSTPYVVFLATLFCVWPLLLQAQTPAAPDAAGRLVAPTPSQSTKDGPVWVRVGIDCDPDKLAAKDLGYGQRFESVEPHRVVMNYSKAAEVGWGANTRITFVINLTPPEQLRPGDRFELTINGTAERYGPDADKRAGQQGSCAIGVSPAFQMSVSPHSNGMQVEGKSVAVGQHGPTFWESDSRTYLITFPEGGSDDASIRGVHPRLRHVRAGPRSAVHEQLCGACARALDGGGGGLGSGLGAPVRVGEGVGRCAAVESLGLRGEAVRGLQRHEDGMER